MKLVRWVRRNPKTALLVTMVALMPLSWFANYVLLITGVITADEFATITSALFPFLTAL